jgi:hypothetical protein
VLYEVEMLHGNYRELEVVLRVRIGEGRPPLVTKNALLEAWTVHRRNLSHFLSGDNARLDDIIAADYFDDAGWEAIKPSRNHTAADRRVGKEVAHLTYARLDVKPDERQWHVGPGTRELVGDVQTFASAVAGGRVLPHFRRQVRRIQDDLGPSIPAFVAGATAAMTPVEAMTDAAR